MGWFSGTLHLMGSAMRGANAVSLWTGNMIYTGLQNARTKKEVRALYQHAADANFRNRGVTVLPCMDKQALLLTTGEPDDNDVYDLDGSEQTAALDYIWGADDTPDSMIVSGGRNEDRIRALIPFVYKAQTDRPPVSVAVLHCGNRRLEQMLNAYTAGTEIVSRTGVYYDVFRGMPVDDIAGLLYETMPEKSAGPNAEALLRALSAVLLRRDNGITLHSLAAFPVASLKQTADSMFASGQFSKDEYDEISMNYMMGAQEAGAVQVFLHQLSKQAESVCGKPRSAVSNIKRMLTQGMTVVLEVGRSGTELLTALIAHHLELLRLQNRSFVLVLDDLPLGRCPELCSLLRGGAYAVSSQDFIASLHGTQQGDDLFAEITGGVRTTVLFRHSSGLSCQKWSEHFGKYRKIRIRQTLTQTNAYMNTSNSWGLSVDEQDEPRIRAETVGRLADGAACIHSIDGILIADVREPT